MTGEPAGGLDVRGVLVKTTPMLGMSVTLADQGTVWVAVDMSGLVDLMNRLTHIYSEWMEAENGEDIATLFSWGWEILPVTEADEQPTDQEHNDNDHSAHRRGHGRYRGILRYRREHRRRDR